MPARRVHSTGKAPEDPGRTAIIAAESPWARPIGPPQPPAPAQAEDSEPAGQAANEEGAQVADD